MARGFGAIPAVGLEKIGADLIGKERRPSGGPVFVAFMRRRFGQESVAAVSESVLGGAAEYISPPTGFVPDHPAASADPPVYVGRPLAAYPLP